MAEAQRAVPFVARALPFLAARARFLIALLATLTALGRAARWHWTFDLLANFPLQLAFAALVCLAVLVAARRWLMAGVACATVGVNGWLLYPSYVEPVSVTRVGPTYRAVLANVLRKNEQHAGLIELIRATQPDFFAILELDDRWLAGIEPVRNAYPHSVVHTRNDNFGLGLFSRHTITAQQVRYLAGQPEPVITARLMLDGRELFVIVAHPIPPVGAVLAAQRNKQLRELGKIAHEASGARMLLGDLNATPWSPHFQDLLVASGLRDARLGFGVQGSWPYRPALVRIPIDHTLVSPEIDVLDRRVERDISSDHRPILLDWQFQP